MKLNLYANCSHSFQLHKYYINTFILAYYPSKLWNYFHIDQCFCFESVIHLYPENLYTHIVFIYFDMDILIFFF